MQHLLNTLEYMFAIVTLLGGVIAVHEFGHFLFAKLCNTRVDTFSIGFGPKLFSKKWGETEYCLSVIPLGGFVKIHGQDPEEYEKEEFKEPNRALFRKSFWERIGVYIGGPLFNYFLAIFIFAFMAIAGNKKLPPIATRIVANTAAYKAGLRSGDQIISVAEQPVKTFDEVAEILARNPDSKIPFKVIRDGVERSLTIGVSMEKGLTPYGETAEIGTLDGLEPLGQEAVVATTKPGNGLGLKNGDRILAINETAIGSWEDIESFFEKITPKLPNTLNIKVLRDGKELTLQSPNLAAIKRKLGAKFSTLQLFRALEIYSPELFIQKVMGGSPAEKAGLKAGDRIVSVNNEEVYSFESLRGKIQQVGEARAHAKQNQDNALTFVIERDGKLNTIQSSVLESKGKDPLGSPIFTYSIGIQSSAVPKFPANMILERTWNPAKALWIGLKDTWDATAMTVIGIKKLVFGEVSFKAVGGPIMIGKIAGDTFSSRGWRDFLRIMAVISISLGVFNLLPIPILDGGHVVFAIIESVRGRPLSPSAMQVSLKVGLSLLLVLMVFAVFNDLMKVF